MRLHSVVGGAAWLQRSSMTESTSTEGVCDLHAIYIIWDHLAAASEVQEDGIHWLLSHPMQRLASSSK